MLDLFLPPLLAGLAVAALAGPLGCFLVWRRMAYFGDTLAHGALLGIALGALLSLNALAAVALTGVLLAGGLYLLSGRRDLGQDTLLGVLAHGALAVGIIAVSLIDGLRPDMTGLLFGDLLGVNMATALWTCAIAAVALLLLWRNWRPLLAATLDEDLARVEGVPVDAVKFLLMVALALTVAIAMKVVGILLVTALLVIPAASARRYAHNPEGMAVGALLLGMLGVIGGMAGSWFADIPAGPAIVATALLLFVLSRLVPAR